MPAAVPRPFVWVLLLAAALICVPLTGSLLAGYIGDDDSDQPNPGFGQFGSGGNPTEFHYHVHHHYHSPYVSHSDDGPLPGYGPGVSRPFAPNGVAGGNRYYTQGYLNSSRTPASGTQFLSDSEDAGDPTEIQNTPDELTEGNDEVGENVDQPDPRSGAGAGGPNAGGPFTSGFSGQSSGASHQSNAPQSLSGDRGYLRVIVPMPDTRLTYDGHELPGKGLLRTLLTPRIRTGEPRPYRLTAYWQDESGRQRVSTRQGTIHAGDHETVEFDVTVGAGNND